MKKLDQYIIGKFLVAFFYTALLFTMIAIVIDFAEKSEKILNSEASWNEVVFTYYLNYIPYINGLLWPLFSLISVIFFTSRLASNSEIISLFNAGIRFERLLLPYLMGAFFIATLYFIGGHYIIPKANKQKFDFEYSKLRDGADRGRTRDVHFMLDDESKIYVRYYRKSDTSARDVRIEEFDGAKIKKVTAIKALRWAESPNIWEISEFTEHYYYDDNEKIYHFPDSSYKRELNLFPSDFEEFKHDRDQLTSTQLLNYLEEQRRRGRSGLRVYEVEFHRRTADAVTIIILTIIGMAVASRKERGGAGVHLAVGIALGAIFVFLSRFSIAFATNQAGSALLGVWIPNILFFFISLFLLSRAQR
ncbi:MAG: LptF/LptG family permease [Bacteroidetes bacterium]|jgi:lipopolysaccharide export system permease protein|nr:LptF/LptG family permease [Bacteroidota bacterium]